MWISLYLKSNIVFFIASTLSNYALFEKFNISGKYSVTSGVILYYKVVAKVVILPPVHCTSL